MKLLCRHLLLFITLCFIFFTSAYAGPWKTLAPGIEYQDLGSKLLNTWSHIHVFKINLKENELQILLAKHLAKPHASAQEFAAFSQALIALNGGFFDHNYHPLGLRISKQQQHNPIKNISWWGVFYIKNQTPYLASAKHFALDKNIDFALQSGPRLIVNGKIPRLKPGLAERSALGISKQGEVIILVTENSPLTPFDLAKLLRSSPLDCENALNLDGGSSSQLVTNFDSLKIHAHDFAKVSDAIIVRART